MTRKRALLRKKPFFARGSGPRTCTQCVVQKLCWGVQGAGATSGLKLLTLSALLSSRTLLLQALVYLNATLPSIASALSFLIPLSLLLLLLLVLLDACLVT